MKIDKYFRLWADKGAVYFDEVEPFEFKPKGEWIDNTCSNCGNTSILNPYALVERNGHVEAVLSQKFCYNCGAEMGAEDD